MSLNTFNRITFLLKVLRECQGGGSIQNDGILLKQIGFIINNCIDEI